MSQTWTDDVFEHGHQGETDLQNMENNFAALKSAFSGAGAPSNAVAGMPWYHTSKGLRVRNAGNAAWLKVLQGDATSKVPHYRNDTAEGWIVDASVTDRVIAIKGGSNAYNVNGGTTAGTWNWAHTHTVSRDGWGSLDTTETHSGRLAASGQTSYVFLTQNDNNTGSGLSDTLRPAAAVCTLQYPDLS